MRSSDRSFIMGSNQPFVFTAATHIVASRAAWAEQARKIEALGYDCLGIGDHFNRFMAPVPALIAAAHATTTMKVWAIFANDFRHPAALAKEIATVDVLIDGRLYAFAIGAGWYKAEYDQVGIPWDPPGVRVSRMIEAVRVIRGLWGDGPFSFDGEHYTISELDGDPKPVQRPHPPIAVGGGGRRMLSFAAREADIVMIDVKALPDGGSDMTEVSEAALARKAGWIRAAAGDRWSHLELNIIVRKVTITDDRVAAAERLASTAGAISSASSALQAEGLTAEDLLNSPHYLIGSVDGIVEQLQRLRELYGVSSFVIYPEDVESFAPVVRRLTKKQAGALPNRREE
jgi:probable F420-dependent oxidoreductase